VGKWLFTESYVYWPNGLAVCAVIMVVSLMISACMTGGLDDKKRIDIGTLCEKYQENKQLGKW